MLIFKHAPFYLSLLFIRSFLVVSPYIMLSASTISSTSSSAFSTTGSFGILTPSSQHSIDSQKQTAFLNEIAETEQRYMEILNMIDSVSLSISTDSLVLTSYISKWPLLGWSKWPLLHPISLSYWNIFMMSSRLTKDSIW